MRTDLHDPATATAALAGADEPWHDTPLAVPHWLERASGFPPGSAGDGRTAGSTAAVATARGLTLTRGRIDEVVAFTELLCGRALPAAEAFELEEDIVDSFEDAPAATLRTLRPLTDGVGRVHGMDPVDRAVLRLQALTTSWSSETRRLTDGEDPSPIMEIVARHNPLVRHWAATGVVLVRDAVDARVAQHELAAVVAGRSSPAAPALRERLVEATTGASALENAELAAAEVRLLCLRAWLRDLGERALDRTRTELARALDSALDTDLVVQQLAHRAAMAVASDRLTA